MLRSPCMNAIDAPPPGLIVRRIAPDRLLVQVAERQTVLSDEEASWLLKQLDVALRASCAPAIAD